MYSTHAKAIAQHGLKTPDGMHSIIRFTIFSIQQPVSKLHDLISDYEIDGLDCKHLNYSLKRAGVAYALKHKIRIHKDLKEFVKNGLDDVNNIANAIHYLMHIPNIGMVKSGFILQMLGFDVACIDSHNLTRLGMKQSQVSIAKTLKYETKIKKIKAYVQMVQVDGAEYWWNSWCHYVAGTMANKTLKTGEAVSEFHVKCVIR